MYASKETLLGLLKRREEDVTLADGQTLRIREVTTGEYIESTTAAGLNEEGKIANPAMMYAVLCRYGVIDGPNGQPLFTDEDLPALANARNPIGSGSTWGFVQIVGEEIYRLSGVGPATFQDDSLTTDTPTNDAPLDRGSEIETGLSDAG